MPSEREAGPVAPRRYRVILARDPQRLLRKLPQPLLRRLLARLHDLEADPRPDGCRKLTGYDDLWRIRVGDWRIIYAIEDDRLLVLVVDIAPRGRAYHDF